MTGSQFYYLLDNIRPGDRPAHYPVWAYQALTDAVRAIKPPGDPDVLAMRIAGAVAFTLHGQNRVNMGTGNLKRAFCAAHGLSPDDVSDADFCLSVPARDIEARLRPHHRLTVEAIHSALTAPERPATPLSDTALRVYLHICCTARGEGLYAHTPHVLTHVRNRLMKEERQQGLTVRQLCTRWGLSVSFVYDILKRGETHAGN